MHGLATTTVSILRGETTNEFGDPVDSTNAVYTGIRGSVLEQTRMVMSQGSATPMVVRLVTCRLPNGTDVKDTDRIQDETTGYIYDIHQISNPQNPMISNNLRLDLHRVSDSQ